MWWTWFLLCLVPVSSQYYNISENINSNPCTDRNHLVLAPGVLTAGGTNRACVSRFYTEGPARLQLSLLTADRQTVTVLRELPPGDGGCLDVNVPLLPNTKTELIVNIRYPEAQCTWERRITLRISSGRVVAVATERARYKRGESLRLRVLALRPDLTPSHGLIDEIWVEGPSGAWDGSRVTQWQKVRTRMGLAQLQYPLDELAPVGKWTVRAKLSDGSQGSASFWVGDYELPPFQLSVRHAPKVLRSSERLVWTVCVRYPWSEAVEGMLVIRLRGTGASGGVRTAVQLRAPKPCHRHAVAARRLGLDGADPPDVVIADFSFQEEGTRIWQNTTVVSQVVDKRVTLEFLTKHRAVISPGLPYKIKVKATRWDDKPATNEQIRVCRFPASQPNEMNTRDICADASTDDNGIAAVMFAPGDEAAPFYKFEAHQANETVSSASLVVGISRGSRLAGALGPLRPDSAARTLVPLYLNTKNITKAITVHFVVITRGGIIYRWGATTQCPISNSADQVRTASRNSPCNYPTTRSFSQKMTTLTQRTDNIGIYDDVPQRYFQETNRVANPGFQEQSGNSSADWLLDRQQFRIMLPIKVSHQMCPDSHLIAYFYYEGELVSATKHFEMEECFGTKAEATWLTRQALPGTAVSLQVSTPGPAICGLSVLDTASKWTQAPPSAKDIVTSGLRRLMDSHRNLTEYDAAGECFLNTDTPEVPTASIDLTATWLAAAGVRLLGGDPTMKRRCEPGPPAALITEETVTLRSDFSEAWLWRLLAVSSNGTGVVTARAPDSITRFEASAVCVSRNGVAVSQPAVLQVFREFFIHADSPKRLRRGDTAIIRYRIFNYLYEPLSVQIQILTDSDLEGPAVQVESVCVAARASAARRAEVRARGVTSPRARLRLRARAVRDAGCGNVSTAREGVSDEVLIRITVDPEGVPVHEQKSILLCGNNGTSDPNTTKVQWSWPPVESVPGTETLTVWAVGDVTGPLLADADSLLLIPRGCGEQNMAQLATNLLALSLLDPSSVAAFTAREHVARGFARQLQYIHPSGGFSAFGSSDSSSSTWLTAFAVRYLRRAHKILWPNLEVPPSIIRAERWLLSQQMENGCFRNEGQVFHRELRGGLNEESEVASVGLTAYVITSLIESTSFLPHRVIRNSLSCLRALPPYKPKSPTRVYAHALLAYAFVKIDKYEKDLWQTNEAGYLKKAVGMLEEDEGMRHVIELLKIAKRSGDYMWWEANSLSTSIEATGYALLALRASEQRLASGAERSAGRWLAAHRASSGGFVSTQDTLVGLEALSAWSDHTSDTHLNVTAHSSGLDQSVTLQPGVHVPDVMKMRPGERLSVSVEGTGCALIQATRSYNTLSPASAQEKLLSLQVAVHTDGPFDCDDEQSSCSCAAVIETCIMWSGVFPEMALVEVSLPGGYGADARLLYSQLNKPNSLLRRIELTPSNTRSTFYLATRDGSDTTDRGGHQCYNIHAVGPKTKTKPAYARVQDYYNPSVNDTQVFTIPEDCPPRIGHNNNPYESSDNLFAKSRSLDSGEILINHDFSYEDIPDGIIPLEDPLYENLTKKERVKESLEVEQLKTTDSRSILNTNDALTNNRFEYNKPMDQNQNLSGNNIKSELDLKVSKYNSVNNLIPPAEIILNTGANANPYDTKQYIHDKNQGNIKSDTFIKNDQEIQSSVNNEQYINNNSKFGKVEIATTKTIISEKIVAEDTRYDIPGSMNPDTGFKPSNIKVDNPNLSSFHVIDSEKDLEVPTGMEGPVPTVVLPPPDFVRPPNDFRRLQSIYTPRGPYSYYRYDDNVYNRRYFTPVQPIYIPRQDNLRTYFY